MKPGDLIRLVSGPDRTWGVQGKFGIVISCYQIKPNRHARGGYCLEVRFPDYTLSHPNFPSDMIEVIDASDEVL